MGQHVDVPTRIDGRLVVSVSLRCLLFADCRSHTVFHSSQGDSTPPPHPLIRLLQSLPLHHRRTQLVKAVPGRHLRQKALQFARWTLRLPITTPRRDFETPQKLRRQRGNAEPTRATPEKHQRSLDTVSQTHKVTSERGPCCENRQDGPKRRDLLLADGNLN